MSTVRLPYVRYETGDAANTTLEPEVIYLERYNPVRHGEWAITTHAPTEIRVRTRRDATRAATLLLQPAPTEPTPQKDRSALASRATALYSYCSHGCSLSAQAPLGLGGWAHRSHTQRALRF